MWQVRGSERARTLSWLPDSKFSALSKARHSPDFHPCSLASLRDSIPSGCFFRLFLSPWCRPTPVSGPWWAWLGGGGLQEPKNGIRVRARRRSDCTGSRQPLGLCQPPLLGLLLLEKLHLRRVCARPLTSTCNPEKAAVPIRQ